MQVYHKLFHVHLEMLYFVFVISCHIEGAPIKALLKDVVYCVRSK